MSNRSSVIKRAARLIFFVAPITFSFQVEAATVTIDKMFTLANNQIDSPMFGNEVWESGLVDLGRIVLLNTGDSLQLNLTFAGKKRLKLNDGFFDGDESIKIKVDGEGGVGGFPNNKADFEFLFTGVEGGPLLTNPVTGTVTQIPTNGNVDFSSDVNLIDGGMVSFADIHLKLTNKNPNIWSLDKVGVGTDADEITIIPIPGAVLLLGSALGALVLFRSSRNGASTAGFQTGLN